MRSLTNNLSGRWRSLPVVCVVFFGVFYLFLWLYIEPQLVYHRFEVTQKSPFFKTGWLFLQDCLSYPGGPSQYLAAFLTQLCYFSWLGALCITLLAWAIYRLTASLTTIAADSPWRVICYVPALLMLIICGRYENPLSTGVAVLVVVFFSVLYEKISPHLGAARVILFLIVCGIAYYVAGSAALVFVALAALCEFFNRRKVLLCVLYLFFGLVVCWLLGAYVFELETGEVYLYLSPFTPVRRNLEKERLARLFEEVLFVLLPVIILLVNLGRRLAGLIPEKTAKRFDLGRLKWVVQVALLVLIAVPSVLFFFNWNTKKVIQVSHLTCRRMWPEVLTTARKVPQRQYFPVCNHAVNRALYYTGQLGDEMFACPRNYHTTDLVFCFFRGGYGAHVNAIFMERAEVCLELGIVNVAEKVAYEFLGGADDSPFILKQLALINIVKGQIETARVFLRALSKNLIYGREARDLLQRLEGDPQFEHDKRIQYLRSVMMTTDHIYGTYHEGEWLEALLRTNRHNKMAFEYLMAHYLLTRQLDKFIENLPRLDDFGYESIPRHYQEAILLYTGTTQEKVDLGGRKINAEILRQYDEFNKISEKFGDDKQALRQALAPGFGRTYFFYFTFGVSGVWQ